MSRVFIIAGEVSGDTHAAGLMRELKSLDAATAFAGLGGPRMREVGGNGIENWLEDSAVLGLWEVLKHYGYFKRKMNETLAAIAQQRPDAVILVDYPGFNLRVAKAIRKRFKGKIIYYISPQVWAWKKGRIKTMAKVLDLMICIFPFEKPLYEKSGLRTEFPGHPMVDRSKALRKNWQREHHLVGWFPGSRANEVRKLFPTMLDAARAIRLAVPDVRFAVAAATEALAGEMREMAEKRGMPEAKQWIETGTVYDLMQRAEVGAVASGTATLEAACFGLPYVLVYHVNWLTYTVGKMVVRIKNLGIVNILAGRDVVRELIQHDLTADSLAREMADLLLNDERRRALVDDLSGVVATLGEGGSYARAAQIVIECLHA
ncbi:MAG: lipid-A-disaccharide synthase [Verrucomicrobiaceae bacterium]|nr:lipid-A-disaccharide synthase [Verrucomicrobiaceae bacterium]